MEARRTGSVLIPASIAIAAIVTRAMDLKFSQALGEAWMWVCAGLLLVGIGLFFWPVHKGSGEKNDMTFFDQSVTSVGQSGGITAHSVTYRPSPRRLADEDTIGILELVKQIPKQTRTQVSYAANDSEALHLAQEVTSYMVGQGYEVGPPSLKKQTFQRSAIVYKL